MVTNLFVPDRRIVVPKPPSYLKLDMAFAIGAGAKLMDKSRYRSHGTISGATWADGAHGRCLDFTPGSYVDLNDGVVTSRLNFTSEKFSLIARINVAAVAENQTIFNRGFYVVDGYIFWVNTGAALDFRTLQSGDGQKSSSANGAIAADTWYTVGISRNGTSVRVFKDGVDSTTIVGVHQNPASSARSAKIGTYDDRASYRLDGKIEFLRVIGGVALTASEHLAWHNALA